MKIRKIARKDFEAWQEMCLLLWPDESEEEVRKDCETILASSDQTVFIAQDEDGRYAGFINVSLRREYVPGVVSFPIGYVEAILVRAAYRRQGLATKLMQTGEKWAQKKGCKQIASDTWTWNTISQEFHLKAGFSEAEREVHFIKRIDTAR
jgi:aminoglycoside 6'-N-acetyltransferase I